MKNAFTLTPAEQRVADLLATGAQAKEIAETLGLTIATVKCRINTIRDKQRSSLPIRTE